jgi:phospholipase C
MSNSFDRIEHFFVLMLENRSFDHMFGTANNLQTQPLNGAETCPVDPDTPGKGTVPVTGNAGDTIHPDPPHEFRDVHFQLTGHREGSYGAGIPLSMNGFAASAREGLLQGESAGAKGRLVTDRGNGAYALDCHGPSAIPVLRTLAREFAVCERWHASMPGPTWPNRFFAHAASSGGLDNSPGPVRSASAVLIDFLGFEFEHGTIFDRLGEGKWCIYHGDALPQVLAIKGIVNRFLGARANDFRRFSVERFSADLGAGDFEPRYIFIEPDYDILHGFRNGNSQHPEGRVSAGESLIRDVYLAIRRSPLWEKSVLVIAYDEHGGFYDRVEVPSTTPPGDRAINHDKAEFPADFGFNLLGVRVPAVVVSPWIERGIIDSTLYDHTSILRTLEERFNLAALTDRDRVANSFSHLFTRTEPRDDTPAELPEPSTESPMSIDAESLQDDESRVGHALSIGSTAGFLRIAISVEHLLNAREASPVRRFTHTTLGRVFPSFAITTTPIIETHRQALEYIAKVAARLEAIQEAAPIR